MQEPECQRVSKRKGQRPDHISDDQSSCPCVCNLITYMVRSDNFMVQCNCDANICRPETDTSPLGHDLHRHTQTDQSQNCRATQRKHGFLHIHMPTCKHVYVSMYLCVGGSCSPLPGTVSDFDITPLFTSHLPLERVRCVDATKNLRRRRDIRDICACALFVRTQVRILCSETNVAGADHRRSQH